MPSEQPGVFRLSLGAPRLCVSTQKCMVIQPGTFVPGSLAGIPVDMGTCALGPGYPYVCFIQHTFTPYLLCAQLMHA